MLPWYVGGVTDLPPDAKLSEMQQNADCAVPPPTLPPRQQHSDMPICPSKQLYTNGVGSGLKWSGCGVRIRLWPRLPHGCQRLLSVPPLYRVITVRSVLPSAALVPASALYTGFWALQGHACILRFQRCFVAQIEHSTRALPSHPTVHLYNVYLLDTVHHIN